MTLQCVPVCVCACLVPRSALIRSVRVSGTPWRVVVEEGDIDEAISAMTAVFPLPSHGHHVDRLEYRTGNSDYRAGHSDCGSVHPEDRTCHSENRVGHSDSGSVHSEHRISHSEDQTGSPGARFTATAAEETPESLAAVALLSSSFLSPSFSFDAHLEGLRLEVVGGGVPYRQSLATAAASAAKEYEAKRERVAENVGIAFPGNGKDGVEPREGAMSAVAEIRGLKVAMALADVAGARDSAATGEDGGCVVEGDKKVMELERIC